MCIQRWCIKQLEIPAAGQRLSIFWLPSDSPSPRQGTAQSIAGVLACPEGLSVSEGVERARAQQRSAKDRREIPFLPPAARAPQSWWANLRAKKRSDNIEPRMQLYSGTTSLLIEDSTRNRIATKLSDAFFYHFRFYPSPSEVNSWRNSLRAVCQVFQTANLLSHGVILEFQLPLTSKRLDCLVTGQDDAHKNNAVILELKQWEHCEDAAGANEVCTWVGGKFRDVLHPSAQVGQYKTYLEDSHSAFVQSGITLHACSYLHNYEYDSSDILFAAKFQPLLESFPVFTADHVDPLVTYLRPKLQNGDDGQILEAIEKSKYKASRKLLGHVKDVIKGKSEYVLLDDQLVVYDRVLASADQGFKDKKKTVIIVKGGPGTGKSVIALNLLGDLSGRGYNTHYVTGSKAFTTTIRAIVGSRAAQQIKYFNSYSQAAFNDIDVMVCDEAHRIRETSNSRFTPTPRRSRSPQLHELISASKTSVFFIDDDQVVRPGEIGSVNYIRENAEQLDCKVFEYELETQFRCAGSEGFINWVNNTLEIRRTANVLWNVNEPFEFRILDSPYSLETAIKEKVEQNFTARLTAGFCWKWSDPKTDGTLVEDVVIGGYARPWNAKSQAGHLAPGIPAESVWAYDPHGIDQIGCIYTAQGFEFDYVGVIFGNDLVYDPENARWSGDPKCSADSVVRRSGEEFLRNVKNTYRVLLTRGMKGCYVHFMNKATENFFRSRLEFPLEQDEAGEP